MWSARGGSCARVMKDGAALERLAEIDSVAFDKTGTLTTGAKVTGTALADAGGRAAAAALARHSAHPAARAVAAYLERAERPALEHVHEVPGHGVEGVIDGRCARLGRSDWVAEIAGGSGAAAGGLSFAFRDGPLSSFTLSETLRPGAEAAVAGVQAGGLGIEILSGDTREQVARVAAALGVTRARHGATPADKVAHLDRLRAQGHRVLMVGDGLNDAAALAAAHVSMAPASASDAGRRAADFVFTGERLDAVPLAHDIARRTARLVRQNFGLAIAYNAIAIPLAAAGQVTPLIAALAMSASSILVVANSLRLDGRGAPAPDLTLRGTPTLRGAAA